MFKNVRPQVQKPAEQQVSGKTQAKLVDAFRLPQSATAVEAFTRAVDRTPDRREK